MLIGPLLNSAAILMGGVIGAKLGHFIPSRVRTALPAVFGLASMCMGVVMLTRTANMPAMVIALLVGATLGELLRIEAAIGRFALWIRLRASSTGPQESSSAENTFMERYVTVVVLFCASGMGVFGALQEGMTGDFSVLTAKAFLDFCSSIIFATTLGLAVAAIAIPQLIIQSLLFASATIIVPLTTEAMRADFGGVGGVLMLAAGLRICGILNLPIANLLPALVLIMPVSFIWTMVF